MHDSTSVLPRDSDNDAPMHSPLGSRASSVLGGGDAGGAITPPPPPIRYHPILNGEVDLRTDLLCIFNDKEHPPPDDFSPFAGREDFDLADLLYRRVQISAGAIDELMQNWAARPESAGDPPFADHEDLYNTIDATEIGHVPWESFTVSYNKPLVPGDVTPWKTQEYVVHFRDPAKSFISNSQIPTSKRKWILRLNKSSRRGSRVYQDFMSGNWAWRQADIIVQDPATHGSMFVPIILGSDKTTFRRNGDSIGFLAIPKTDRENQDSAEFRTFRWNLFHGSLRHILQSLKPGMTVPEVALFADGHYRRVIYSLGPYITDYPEQVLLACVVQGWCAKCTASRENLDGPSGRQTQLHTQTLFDVLDHGTMWDQYGVIPDADIYELLSPDLLHQVIKGTFKDHLVVWVGEYLENEHSKSKAKKIMADIDRRIAAVPPFPGLRRFPEGRGFKQWTGDDSKALMKVYLLAIEGHVPAQMLRAFSAFLDFCYLVRRNVVDEATLTAIDAALARYHHERTIFVESGVCANGFCLPRQHSLTHYRYLIQEFGAPNGLCSSITESKHIKAVKQPWRRSSRYEALSQMLTINDRLDKLAAARVDFDEDDDGGATDERKILGEVILAKTPVRGYPKNPDALAQHLNLPHLVPLVRRFLYGQDNPDCDFDVFPSAAAKFYAPSDQSGIAGMLRERIRAVRSWRGGPSRHDCVFVEGDPELPGFRGLLAARILLFMSFKYRGVTYPCALVTWFSAIGDEPCPDVGMWMVEPDLDNRGQRVMDIIHVDTILRGAHLIGVYGDHFLPRHFKYSDSLDSFKAFYINKYADHHTHEIAF
ncbi:hypothetical protein B0H13DRAFT_2235917 [Mycena leptocephala]|nr:hypothetical protein B0H13DRAFT_2235917 [Mycena leptocephala]